MWQIQCQFTPERAWTVKRFLRLPVSTLAFGIGSFAIAIVMSSGGMISKSHYRPHGLQEVETVLGALLLVANLFSF